MIKKLFIFVSRIHKNGSNIIFSRFYSFYLYICNLKNVACKFNIDELYKKEKSMKMHSIIFVILNETSRKLPLIFSRDTGTIAVRITRLV